jgi:hypothetical protein
MEQGLNVFKSKIKKSTKTKTILVNTVEANKHVFTHQQFEKAVKASEL